MLVPFLIATALTAALTSLVVESVYGDILRGVLAGTPGKEAWETWKVQARTAELVGKDLPLEPQARWPWLADALTCSACVAFWMAPLVTLVYPWPGDQDVSPWLLWSGIWVAARLLLGTIRAVEEQVS